MGACHPHILRRECLGGTARLQWYLYRNLQEHSIKITWCMQHGAGWKNVFSVVNSVKLSPEITAQSGYEVAWTTVFMDVFPLLFGWDSCDSMGLVQGCAHQPGAKMFPAWHSCLTRVWDEMHSICKAQVQIWYIGTGTASLAAGWSSAVDIATVCAHCVTYWGCSYCPCRV